MPESHNPFAIYEPRVFAPESYMGCTLEHMLTEQPHLTQDPKDLVLVSTNSHALQTRAVFSHGTDVFLRYETQNGRKRTYDVHSYSELDELFGNDKSRKLYFRGILGENLAQILLRELCIKIHRNTNTESRKGFKFHAYDAAPNTVVAVSDPYLAAMGYNGNVILRYKGKKEKNVDHLKRFVNRQVPSEILSEYFPIFLADIDAMVDYSYYGKRGVFLGEAKTMKVDITVHSTKTKDPLYDRVFLPVSQLFAHKRYEHYNYGIFATAKNLLSTDENEQPTEERKIIDPVKDIIVDIKTSCSVFGRPTYVPVITFNETFSELQGLASFCHRRYIQGFEPERGFACSGTIALNEITLFDGATIMVLKNDGQDPLLWRQAISKDSPGQLDLFHDWQGESE